MPSGHAVARPNLQILWPSFIAAVREYALLLLDPDGHVLSWNHGAELIYGYPPGEIVGRHVSHLYRLEDIEGGSRNVSSRLPPQPAASRASMSV
jgi:PAS domain S-box-containing protein